VKQRFRAWPLIFAVASSCTGSISISPATDQDSPVVVSVGAEDASQGPLIDSNSSNATTGTVRSLSVYYTRSSTVPVTIDALGAEKVWLTSKTDCLGDQEWQDFSSTLTVNLSQFQPDEQGIRNVFFMLKSKYNRPSSCFNLKIALDLTAPTLTTGLNQSAINQVTATTSYVLTLVGACSEAGRSVAIAAVGPSVSVVSASTTCSEARTYSIDLDFSSKVDGDYAVQLSHSDLAGNITELAATLRKDAAVPSGTSVVIDSGDTHTNSLSTSLALAASNATEMYITNTAACASGSNWESFAASKAWTLPLSNASNTVYAKFRGSNLVESACVSDSITHDSVAPTVAITSPAAPSTINAGQKSAFVVSGTCSGETASLITVGGSVSATTTCSASQTWSVSLDYSATSDGAVAVTVDHSDLATNPATQATLSLTLDTQSPTVAISAPLSSVNAANQSAYPVNGSCIGVVNGAVITLSHSTLGTLATPTCASNEYSATVNLSTLANGNITIRADLSDAAGNAASQASRTLTKDATAPAAAIGLNWAETSPSSSTSLTAQWTVSAASDLANQNIQFYSDSSCGTAQGLLLDLASTSTAQSTLASAVNGTTYSFKVTSLDGAGNATESACSAGLAVDTRKRFVVSGAASITTGVCEPISLGLQNVEGQSVNAASTITVNLGGKGAYGTYFSDNLCTNAITSTSITTGTGSAQYYFLGLAGELIAPSASDAAAAVVTGSFSSTVVSKYVALSNADRTLCALVQGGTVTCWGNLLAGLPNTASSGGFTVPNLTNVVQFATSYAHGCAVKSDKTVWCWGQNNHKQLGQIPASAAFSNPVQVSGITNAAQVTLGGNTSCARLENGTVRCWGQNTGGVLGVDQVSLSSSETPQIIGGLANVIDISLSDGTGCAVISGGTVKCWGANSDGALGIGSSTPLNSITALDVLNISNAVKVSSARSNNCALLADGGVKCWGYGAFGRLGAGGTFPWPSANAPVDTVNIDDAVGISMVRGGAGVACANNANGTVYCWGYSPSGSNATPFLVAGATDVTSVVSGLGTESTGINACTLNSSGTTIGCYLFGGTTMPFTGNRPAALGNSIYFSTLPTIIQPSCTAITINKAPALYGINSTINLSQGTATGAFYTNSNCTGAPITSVSVPEGTSSPVTVYYVGVSGQSPLFTMTMAGANTVNTAYTSIAGPAVRVQFTEVAFPYFESGSLSCSVNDCCPLDLYSVDAQSKPSVYLTSNTNIGIGSSFSIGGGSTQGFFSDASCSTPASSLTIPSGSNNVRVYIYSDIDDSAFITTSGGGFPANTSLWVNFGCGAGGCYYPD
jgi:large repetitive protein